MTSLLFKNLFRAGALSLTLLLALTGCGSTSNPTVTTPPSSPSSPSPSSGSSFTVASVQPANAATQVATSAAIAITFSAAADASTVNATNITLTGTSAVTGTIAYDSSNNTATFTPKAALAAGTAFTLNVSGVTSADGTALQSPFNSTFKTASPQYQATLFGGTSSSASQGGQVMVDTGGNVTVTLTNATPSTEFTVNFCTAVTSPPCLNVGTVSSDASGSGTATMMFPQPGDWAGDFELESGGTEEYSTALYSTTDTASMNTSNYSSTLVPYTKADEGDLLNAGKLEQDPLANGNITYLNGKLEISVTGALPNVYYEIQQQYTLLKSAECSECFEIGGFETDASGDFSGSNSTKGTVDTSGDIFEVSSGPYAGFIGGFMVPQQ
jgi:hypothetical protein